MDVRMQQLMEEAERTKQESLRQISVLQQQLENTSKEASAEREVLVKWIGQLNDTLDDRPHGLGFMGHVQWGNACSAPTYWQSSNCSMSDHSRGKTSAACTYTCTEE